MKGSHMLTYSNPLIEGRSTLVLWGEEQISQRSETQYTAKLRSKERRVNRINMCNSIHAKESHIKCLECFHLTVSNTDVSQLWGCIFCHISCFVNSSLIYTLIPAKVTILWYFASSSTLKDGNDELSNGCMVRIFFIERLYCQNIKLALCKWISSALSLCQWIRYKSLGAQDYTVKTESVFKTTESKTANNAISNRTVQFTKHEKHGAIGLKKRPKARTVVRTTFVKSKISPRPGPVETKSRPSPNRFESKSKVGPNEGDRFKTEKGKNKESSLRILKKFT